MSIEKASTAKISPVGAKYLVLKIVQTSVSIKLCRSLKQVYQNGTGNILKDKDWLSDFMREDDTVSVLGMLIPRRKYNISLLLYGIIFCIAAVGFTTWEFILDQPKIVAVRSTLSSLARFGFVEAVFFMILPHMRRMIMYWELRKKMPEIIEKAVAEAVAEAVPKAVAETRQEDFARFKQFCEKHGITYTEEDWADENLNSEDE